MSARGMRVVLPAITCATGAVFLYAVGMGSFHKPLASLAGNRFGETARHITEIALIFPAFAIFLLPSCLAVKYAGRFKVVCPSCRQDISSRTDRALSTRCGPACGERILEGGRTHSAAVYYRRQRIQSRHFIKYWLWIWPALGGLIITWEAFNRSAFPRLQEGLWPVPLIGTAAAGWAWLRTFDRRYTPQLLASVVLLGLSAVLFWQAL